MNEEARIKQMIKNAEGKRLLEKINLEYSKKIIDEIKLNPAIVKELLEELEITEEKFFAYISNEIPTNITFYDQTLSLVRKKSIDENKKNK